MPINWDKHRNGDHEGHQITKKTTNGTYCDECMDDLFNPDSPPHSKKVVHATRDHPPCTQLIFDDDIYTTNNTLNINNINNRNNTDEEDEDIDMDIDLCTSSKKNKSNRNKKRRYSKITLSPRCKSYSHINNNNKRRKTNVIKANINRNIIQYNNTDNMSSDDDDNDENDDDHDEDAGNLYDDMTSKQQKLHLQYTSNHEKYNQSKPWQLFQAEDYDKYTVYGFDGNYCTLDGRKLSLNMIIHEISAHQLKNDKESKYKLSDFEIECIPLLKDPKGKCRKRLLDKDWKYLSTKYPNECKKFWFKRFSVAADDMKQEENKEKQ